MGRLVDADEFKRKIVEMREANNKSYEHYDNGFQDAVSQIDDVLDSLPTIDPVKHGHWIDIDFETDRCSECGHDFEFGSGWYFCPLCGAEMDGESE